MWFKMDNEIRSKALELMGMAGREADSGRRSMGFDVRSEGKSGDGGVREEIGPVEKSEEW